MRRPVTNALQHWLNEGLLDAQQVAHLSRSLASADRQSDGGRAVTIFATVGAVLTGLGVILFVAGNWAGMAPIERALVLLAIYGTTVAGAVFSEKRGLPMVADAVWLLSTLVLGANIFLMAQVYNLTLTLWQGTLAWMIAALAMGYARQSVAQAAIAVPLGILTIGWAGGGSGWFFDDQAQFLFADDGLRPVFPLLGLALVGLSTLLARRDDLAFASLPCFRWGTFIVAFTLIATTGAADFAQEFFDAAFSSKQILIIAASMAVVLGAAVGGKFAATASRPAMVALFGLLASLLIPAGEKLWIGTTLGGVHVVFGLYVVAVFAMALLTIWLGIQASNTRLVNVGLVSTTVLIVIQYFGRSFELLDRSLAFVAGGALLIGLAVFVEKARRRILVQMEA